MDILSGPIGVWIAAILTIMVYSFLLGDNPLFALAEHALVGTAIAYAAIVSVHSVLIPRLYVPLAQGNWVYLIPLVLGVLLLAKVRTWTAPLGNVSTGFLIGVGAALAISGALLGTVWPQVSGTIVTLAPADYDGWPGLVNAIIIAFGTIATLLYFHFSRGGTSRAGRLSAALVASGAKVGGLTIMVAFGAIFASLVMSRASLFIGRMQFLLDDWLHVINIP